MTFEWSMTKATIKAVVEAASTAIVALREVGVCTAASRTSGPPLRQPTFDWKAQDKNELNNFEIEVRNMFFEWL